MLQERIAKNIFLQRTTNKYLMYRRNKRNIKKINAGKYLCYKKTKKDVCFKQKLFTKFVVSSNYKEISVAKDYKEVFTLVTKNQYYVHIIHFFNIEKRRNQ